MLVDPTVMRANVVMTEPAVEPMLKHLAATFADALVALSDSELQADDS